MITEQIRRTLWSQGYAFFKVIGDDGELKMLACAVIDHPSETIHLGAGPTPLEALRDAISGLVDGAFSLTDETIMNLPNVDDIPNILDETRQ